MSTGWTMTDEQKLQLAMGAAYETADMQHVGGGNPTIYDLYKMGEDGAGRGRFADYGVGKSHDTGANDWVVTDYCDDDGFMESGFYGCLVKAKDENGQEHAVLLFRGSNDTNFNPIKNPFSFYDTVREWGGANLSLHQQGGIGISESRQQELAAQFAIEMMDKYPDLDFTMLGHSLGGQLSFYTAIYIVKNRPDLKYRIANAYNLDGPGFSDEFIRNNKDAIDWLNQNGKLEHWSWSGVGALEHSPASSENGKRKYVATEHGYFLTAKRHVDKILIDENGNVVLGKKDFMATLLGDASRFLEDYGDLLLYTTLIFTGPIGGFIGFAGMCKWLYDRKDEIGDKIKKGWNGIKKGFSDAYNGFMSFFKKKEKKLDGDYEMNYNRITEVIELYQSVGDYLNSVADEGEEIVLSCWEEIFQTTNSFQLKNLAKAAFSSTRSNARALNRASDGLIYAMGIYKRGDRQAAAEYNS